MSQVAQRIALAAVVLAVACAGPATAKPLPPGSATGPVLASSGSPVPIPDVVGGHGAAAEGVDERPSVPISDIVGSEGRGYGTGSSADATPTPVAESSSVPISDVRSGNGYGDGVPADLAPATAVTVADGGDVSVLAFVLSLAGMAVLAAAGAAAVSSRARRGQRHPA